MKRVNILWLLLNSLFLIVFNLLFFMFGNAENSKTSVWISYGFIHFAYFMLLATPYMVRNGSAAYIYSRPLFTITSSYFIMELLVGIVFILVAPESIKTTLIVQVIMATIYIAWLLSHLIANEHTAESVERHAVEIQYVKESASQVNSILKHIDDRTLAKKVEQVYDLLHSSQVKSDSSVRSLEGEIISEINNLERIVERNDLEQAATLADKIFKLAEKRNRQLKLLN